MDELISPELTIVLPIHSKRPWLEECLLSINQSDIKFQAELQILHHNLDSSFSSEIESVVSRLITNPLFNVIHIRRTGISFAELLNYGICQTKSKFIARIDDDDLVEKYRFNLQIHEFNAQKDLVLLGGQMRIIDESGIYIRSSRYPISDLKIRKLMEYSNCFAHSAVMFRRDKFMDVGMYKDDYPLAEDFDLWVRLSKSGKVSNLSRIIGSYRLHSDQTTFKASDLQNKSIYRVISDQEVSNKKLKIISKYFLATAMLSANKRNKYNFKSISSIGMAFAFSPTTTIKYVLYKLNRSIL